MIPSTKRLRLSLACGPTLMLLALAVIGRPAWGDEPRYSVGAAKVEVTPRHPTLLAGYGGRTEEHTAVDTPLWARALAIGAPKPAVLIAVDNCGVPAAVVEEVARRLRARVGLPRERLVVASTHTHNAPTLAGYAPIVWRGRASDEQRERTGRYTEALTVQLCEVAEAALAARQPARLEWGQGRATFGGNRRVLRDGRWAGFGYAEDGPVDHSVPVLLARSADGDVAAVWVNYACHCTTLGSRNSIAGDWAGFANEFLEESFPDAVALTTIGCGADIGPQPTGGVEFARRHGRSIADEVRRLAASGLTPLSGPLETGHRELRLPLEALPPREHWKRASEAGGFEGEHARLMLDRMERDGELPAHVPYPLATWRFGDELAIVFLAGEVTVDYAVRLKQELDWTRLWLNGWCNDVACYVPSRRLLLEGGYEADFSMIYYAQPARFAPEVEEVLVTGVKAQVGESFAATAGTPDPAFLRPPSRLEQFAAGLDEWLHALPDDQRAAVAEVVPLAAASREGFAHRLDDDAEEDRWFDYSGRRQPVYVIRQEQPGTTIRWQTAPLPPEPNEREVFVFLGGLGWKSQPQSEGFVLLVGDEEVLPFDLTQEPRVWSRADGSVTLRYVPTWRSDEDSAGMFHLTVDRSRVQPGQPCRIGVRARGGGSKRWFALHPVTDARAVEAILVRAIVQARLSGELRNSRDLPQPGAGRR